MEMVKRGELILSETTAIGILRWSLHVTACQVTVPSKSFRTSTYLMKQVPVRNLLPKNTLNQNQIWDQHGTISFHFWFTASKERIPPPCEHKGIAAKAKVKVLRRQMISKWDPKSKAFISHCWELQYRRVKQNSCEEAMGPILAQGTEPSEKGTQRRGSL